MILYDKVIPPGRCPVRRKARWWEIVRAKLFGRMLAIELDYELQCWQYAGHIELGKENPGANPNIEYHETCDGTRWT